MTLKFNPSFQTDDESVENFIVRRYQFETIIDGLRVAAKDPGKAPRFLVPAPRGAGKTTLCRRVVAETRMSQVLRDAWQAVFLGEESYTVTTPGEFFLECLLQLKDEVRTKDLASSHLRATEARSEDELIDLALEGLENFVQSSGKRLILIVENFHTILNVQMQDVRAREKSNLIEILDKKQHFSVLATSVTQASDDQGTPLPEYFRRIGLPPLSLGECRELWETLTGAEVSERKLRPLQILTGGSPRLLHILADFTQTPSLRDLLANLNYLIDQYTEYFKSQLDALPAIERKVFVTLLDLWDPSTAKQVAEASRVTTNTASAMLARLTDRGAVVKELGQGRSAIYVAAERLFNIYYLMRRRSHPSRRVRALVSFMMFYYDSDELVDTTASLVREACSFEPARRGDYHSTFDAIISSSSEAVRHRILARTSPDFLQSFRDHHRASLDVTRYLHQSTARADDDATTKSKIERIDEAEDEGNLDTAHELCIDAIQKNDATIELWIRLTFLELRRGNFDAAVKAGEWARQLDPDDSWSHAVLGYALTHKGRSQEAEESYLIAIEKDPGQPLALAKLASIKVQRGEVGSALALFEAARKEQGLTDLSRCAYAGVLDQIGRTGEAVAILEEGAQEFENELSRKALVELLEAEGRQDDGTQLLESAAEAFDRWEAWADFGSYLLARTSRFTAARDALRKAIDKGGDRPSLYEQLARAVVESGGRHEAAASIAEELLARFRNGSRAWATAGQIYESLNDDISAEKAYRAALERENGAFALRPLARLVRKQESRHHEAEELLRRSVEATEGSRKCVPSRELAELYIHRGDKERATEAIELALQSNDRCACCLALYGDMCRRGGDIFTAEKHYRTALQVDVTMIEALTGLAELVHLDEAQELIEQAVRADPANPRVLLTRARLKRAVPDTRVKDAEAALELNPNFIDARLFLASLEAERANVRKAIQHLEEALRELPLQQELIPNFVSAAMRAFKVDGGASLSALLDHHEHAKVVEPLAVAVRLLRGETPMVAKEIRDVAWDIIVRHGQNQDSSMESPSG